MLFVNRIFFLFFLINLIYVNCDVDVNNDSSEVNKKLESVEEDVPRSGLELEHEIINEQQSDQPTSDERFIAVHIDTLGSKEQLRPTLPGLSTMALQFLPPQYQLVNVLSATREMVVGIRYELIVCVVQESGDKLICTLDVLEKPWITTEWGDKLRQLQYSNCSTDFENTSGINMNNGYDNNHNYKINPVFVNQAQDMSPERMVNLEGQIIPDRKSAPVTTRAVTERTTTDLPVPELDDSMKEILDTFFAVNRDVPISQNTANTVDGQANKATVEDAVIPKKITTVTTEIESFTTPSTEIHNVVSNDEFNPCHNRGNQAQINIISPPTQVPQQHNSVSSGNNNDFTKFLYQPIQNYNSVPEIDSVALYFSNHNNNNNGEGGDQQQQIVEPFFSESVSDYLPNVQENLRSVNINGQRKKREINKIGFIDIPNRALEQIDHIDSDDHKRVTLDVLSVKELQSDFHCSLYLIRVKTANSQCKEQSTISKDCLGDLIHGTIKYCNLEVKVCKDDSLQLRKSECLPDKRKSRSTGIVGGISDIDLSQNEEEVHKLLNEALVSLEGDPGGDSYSLVRIINATRQVVAGILYRIAAEVLDKNGQNSVVCNVEIWNRPWITPNGREVTMSCNNEKLYKFRQRRSAHRMKRQTLVGAPKPIDVESDDVKNFVQNSLVSINGEGNNYKVHRITEATKQVVSGILYEITVEFESPESEIVICHLSIWDRPWVKSDGRKTSVSCDNEKNYTFRSKRSLIYDHRNRAQPYPKDVELEETLFNNFRIQYNKTYHSTMERQMRLRIFRTNLAKIEQLNNKEMGTAKYGITEFADLTSTEYRQRTGLWRREESNDISHPMANIPDKELPPKFDWRDKGVISNVKNQGNCGSCWAFSVTGNIEGLHAIKSGQLEEYSEQELLDCDTVDGACNGGLPDNAYKAIEQIGGLELESQYPYKAKKGHCNFNKTLSHVTVSGAVDLPKNETAMALWLITNGPISIGINANAMQFYRGGISHPWRPLCRHNSIDHGVLIVGFGVADYPLFNKTLPYWIIKNSWGPNWGEKGYYRVYRGDNTCGVNSMASSAVLA